MNRSEISCELDGADCTNSTPAYSFHLWAHPSNQPCLKVHRYTEDRVDQAERRKIESFIKAVYWRHHHARLHYFMPTLLASVCEDTDAPQAVVGLRFLDREPIFLEQYLVESIECTLRRHQEQAVPRNQIAEIGNLACTSPRVSPQMIAVVAFYLAQRKKTWAVFTGTSMVHRLLVRVGLDVIDLEKAEGACLGEQVSDWGTYYQQNPHVMAVRVPEAVGIVSQRYSYAMPEEAEGELK